MSAIHFGRGAWELHRTAQSDRDPFDLPLDELERGLAELDVGRMAELVDSPMWERGTGDVHRRALDQLRTGTLSLYATPYGTAPRSPATAPLAEYEEATDLTPAHAIELELVGEDDEPIPFARYEIELPNGDRRHGRLDRSGRAEVRNIREPGQCRVSFPDLDEEAWEPVDTQPLS